MFNHVIIGGSDAGISAALRIKEIAPTHRVRMLLKDQYPNYSICGIPFYLSGEISDWKTLRSNPSIISCVPPWYPAIGPNAASYE